MNSGVWWTVATIVGSILAAYITARTSRKKEPEDRDAIITETTNRLQRMFKDCLDRLDEAIQESVQMRDHYEERIDKLEKEVVRLGGDPRRLNGGGV